MAEDAARVVAAAGIMKASPRAAAREPQSVAARTRSSIDLSGARDWRERIMADEDYLVLTETPRKPSERPRVSRSPTPHAQSPRTLGMNV